MSFNQQKARQIWTMVGRVPPGKVANYGLIADLAGLPGRARMVGTMMQYAPDEMNLPWYRILKSNGQLAFKPGSNMAHKQTGLLQEEGVLVFNNRVNLKQFLWHPDLAELLMFEY
jgi:methylated-DNA-protein-cysteine methyltransferase-like protein